jgi:hypothetical protein
LSPEKIRPDRLQELLPKLLAGALTEKEREEIILGHWRLANALARKRAKQWTELKDDLDSEAQLALVVAVDAYRGGDEPFDKFLVRQIGNPLDRFLKKTPEIPAGESLEWFHKGKPPVRDTDWEFVEEVAECPMDKDICRLRSEGFKDREIAEKLNCSLSYVNNRRKAMERRNEERNPVHRSPPARSDQAAG